MICGYMIWPKDEFTRFEVARILGARSLQIALGAPTLVKIEKEKDPVEIAKKEFREKKVPITVKRELPDKTRITINTKKAIENWIEKNNGEI